MWNGEIRCGEDLAPNLKYRCKVWNQSRNGLRWQVVVGISFGPLVGCLWMAAWMAANTRCKRPIVKRLWRVRGPTTPDVWLKMVDNRWLHHAPIGPRVTF